MHKDLLCLTRPLLSLSPPLPYFLALLSTVGHLLVHFLMLLPLRLLPRNIIQLLPINRSMLLLPLPEPVCPLPRPVLRQGQWTMDNCLKAAKQKHWLYRARTLPQSTAQHIAQTQWGDSLCPLAHDWPRTPHHNPKLFLLGHGLLDSASGHIQYTRFPPSLLSFL